MRYFTKLSVTQDQISSNGKNANAELTGVRYYNARSTSKVPQPLSHVLLATLFFFL